ncbi:MAG: HAD family hydrolase [Roseburia sp.]|nr:HAD family hydrolase [Roseburia sp.]
MKSFIFDLYNTLIDVRTDEHCERAWAPVVSFLAERGISVDWRKLCAEFDLYWKIFGAEAVSESEYEYPECDCVEQFKYIARQFGCDLPRSDAATMLCRMRKSSIEWLRLFDGTIELLDGLHARGAKTYLLSNAQAAFTLDEIKEVGLDGKFDGVLLSSDCGVRKPDKAFFGMLFDKYGIKKYDAVMVGDDKENDVGGAKKFGIKGVWVPGGAAKYADELYALVG